jgi:hypothetical protein
MAQLNEVFSTDDLPQGNSGDFTPLPDGWYSAHISKSELCMTKAGTGQYIKLRYDITGPTHQGRVVFGNLNIRNPNPKAEEIGRQQLGDIMRAIGLAKVQDTDQLIGGSLLIKLATKAADGQYDASNEIKGFKAVEGAAMPRPSAPAAPAGIGAATPPVSPPWGRK